MWWDKPKPIIEVPKPIPPKPNKYITGAFIFAEWVDSREGEKWCFFHNSGKSFKFSTDTEENAKILMTVFDNAEVVKSNLEQNSNKRRFTRRRITE
jgi:hypothetical protein